jgi:sugar lactone lactonase YvrE
MSSAAVVEVLVSAVATTPTARPEATATPAATRAISVAHMTVREGLIFDPGAIAVDAQGNYYVIEAANNRIQRFNPGGVFLNQWGGQGSGEGQFEHPTGIAVAGDDTVYVVDTINHLILRFTADGGFLSQWGNMGSGEGKFYWAQGIAVAGDGKVYVADT